MGILHKGHHLYFFRLMTQRPLLVDSKEHSSVELASVIQVFMESSVNVQHLVLVQE